MLKLNLTRTFESKSPADRLRSLALFPGSGIGALSRFHVFFATSLATGLLGGLAPAALWPQLHQVLETADRSAPASPVALNDALQANAALTLHIDSLEKRLAKIEQTGADMNPTGAIAPTERPLRRAKITDRLAPKPAP